MTYKTEFPDFDYTLPTVPGFEDASWHNDICPSLMMRLHAVDLTIWCDYADRSKREFREGDQYGLTIAQSDGTVNTLANSDRLDEVLAAAARYLLTKTICAVPVDLLNHIFDERCASAERLGVGKLSAYDVGEIAHNICADVGSVRVKLDDEYKATWSRA